jgi:hypothetical protein
MTNPNLIHGAKQKKRVKFEFIVGIDKMYDEQDGLHITGILSIPRASLNGWIYLPEELEKQDNKTVPMFFEHEEMFNPNAEPIGVMNTFWNNAFLQLQYDAIVTNKEKVEAIRSGRFNHVSMGATWEDFDLIRGWLFPKGVEIVEGSLVAEPGIPEASVSIIDHVRPATNANNDSKLPFIPTKICTSDFCNSILKDREKVVGRCGTNVDDSLGELNPKESIQITHLPATSTIKVDRMEEKDSQDREEEKDNKEKLEHESKADKEEKSEVKRKFAVMDVNGLKLLLQENSKCVVDAMRDVVSPLQNAISSIPKPNPTAMICDEPSKEAVKDRFYKISTDSLRKFQELDWKYISEQLKANGIAADAIGLAELGGAAGAQWLEDLTIIPAGLSVGLRNTCEVVIIERGAKEAHFTLIATPTPAAGSPPTVPADVAQAITDVPATPSEQVLKQRITDQAMRATSTNLAAAVAATFRNAEILDEDDKILTELNGIATGNLAGDFFGGNATSESTIDSGDTFDHKLLAKAKRAILRKGWQEARMSGNLVCAMSPEQMEQLMSDTNIQRFIEWVNDGEAIRTGAIPRLHGVDLLVTTKVPTGTGAGMPAVTTHRAFVYIRNVSVGLAFTKDLQIETARYPEERATTIVGSYELAAKNKRADAVARIATYGSG